MDPGSEAGVRSGPQGPVTKLGPLGQVGLGFCFQPEVGATVEISTGSVEVGVSHL